MRVYSEILRRGMACALIGTLAGSVPLVAQAQSCPAGYYYASDGNCYPGPPPTYPPPAYDSAPPVTPPPLVMDGMLIGLGLLLGSVIASDRDDHRGGPGGHRGYERGHR